MPPCRVKVCAAGSVAPLRGGVPASGLTRSTHRTNFHPDGPWHARTARPGRPATQRRRAARTAHPARSVRTARSATARRTATSRTARHHPRHPARSAPHPHPNPGTRKPRDEHTARPARPATYTTTRNATPRAERHRAQRGRPPRTARNEPAPRHHCDHTGHSAHHDSTTHTPNAQTITTAPRAERREAPPRTPRHAPNDPNSTHPPSASARRIFSTGRAPRSLPRVRSLLAVPARPTPVVVFRAAASAGPVPSVRRAGRATARGRWAPGPGFRSQARTHSRVATFRVSRVPSQSRLSRPGLPSGLRPVLPF